MNVVALVVWTTFVVWYTIRARWWELPVGWNTFAVSLAITALIGGVVHWTLYLFVAILGLHRIYLMERAQWVGRRLP